MNEKQPVDERVENGAASDGSYSGPRERPVNPNDDASHPPATGGKRK